MLRSKNVIQSIFPKLSLSQLNNANNRHSTAITKHNSCLLRGLKAQFFHPFATLTLSVSLNVGYFSSFRCTFKNQSGRLQWELPLLQLKVWPLLKVVHNVTDAVNLGKQRHYGNRQQRLMFEYFQSPQRRGSTLEVAQR